MNTAELLLSVEEYEIFNPNVPTIEGKTYAVIPQPTATGNNPEIVINNHVTLAHGTTLIFAGGKISGTGTAPGDNTRLIAPVTQIF